MPGPGIELVGAEETAEVMEVLQSGYLSRYGPSDDPRFKAKVHHVEEAIATLTGVHHAPALHGAGSAALWIALMTLGDVAGHGVAGPGLDRRADRDHVVGEPRGRLPPVDVAGKGAMPGACRPPGRWVYAAVPQPRHAPAQNHHPAVTGPGLRPGPAPRPSPRRRTRH